MSVIYCGHACVINLKMMHRTNRHLHNVSSQLCADYDDVRVEELQVHMHECGCTDTAKICMHKHDG